jgi:hypothetical protein
MSVAKRHRTVPQFYLRGFSESDQIGTVQLPGDRRFLQNVRKAASETGFYNLEGHPDGSDVFEKLLSAIEGDAAAVLLKIEQGIWPLDQADRDCLAHYIAVQAVRGPEQRRNMEFIAAQFARLEIGHGGRANVADWVHRNHGVSITEEQAEKVWEQATQPGGPPIRIRPAAHIEQMVTLVDELFPYLAGRPWTLVRFQRRSLLTCDTPVGLVRQPDDEPRAGVGFMTALAVTFPLSRRLGLVMSDPIRVIEAGLKVEVTRAGKLDHVTPGTVRLQDMFNDVTVSSASQWIYHHPDDMSVVPSELPEPTPVTMGMSGSEHEFSGEPTFAPRQDPGDQTEPDVLLDATGLGERGEDGCDSLDEVGG